MTARNPKAFQRGLEHRQRIKTLMLDHVEGHPLRRHLTVQQIHARLPHLGLSTIYWYVAALHDEAEATAQGWNSSNSSAN